MTTCAHEVWLVPDMALFRGMRNRIFTIRCKECGFEDNMDGFDIACAMERMLELERYEKEQMEIAAHRADYEDSLDRFMKGIMNDFEWWGAWVVQLCLRFGCEPQTAYRVAATFLDGLDG